MRQIKGVQSARSCVRPTLALRGWKKKKKQTWRLLDYLLAPLLLSALLYRIEPWKSEGLGLVESPAILLINLLVQVLAHVAKFGASPHRRYTRVMGHCRVNHMTSLLIKGFGHWSIRGRQFMLHTWVLTSWLKAIIIIVFQPKYFISPQMLSMTTLV